MSGKLLIIAGSPRRNGNTATLAAAVARGAERAGNEVVLRHLDDYVAGFLRDCRTCRDAEGRCTIPDRFEALFRKDYLPSQGLVICSPVYWYGLSAQAKVFFDRSFCYYAASSPDAEGVLNAMAGKRLGLVLASEETYPGASLGIISQIQEYARYTRSDLAGVVRGIGNSGGEVRNDPSGPIAQAEQLGAELFDRPYSDYRLDTPRARRVWPDNESVLRVSEGRRL